MPRKPDPPKWEPDLDLFGKPISVLKSARRGVTGYAYPPGTGPSGETCKTCRHLTVRRFANRYYKCGLVRATGGPATDVRLKSPACRAWEPEQKEE